jgi:hypothetical protein
MIVKNTTYPVNFYCFTDDNVGLNGNIISKPLPTFSTNDIRYVYRKEVGLCDDNLGGLNGQRVLFFDLDVLIVDNIDCFFELPKNEEFYIINDWNSKGDKVGQASCYSWVVGTLGFIKADFELDPVEIYDKFYTASQEYLSSKIIEKCGKLNFWNDDWSKSFKFHCLPTPFIPFLRKIKIAKIPKGAKIICFHGNPKVEDAMRGIWKEKKIWKRILYKHLKPVVWIEKYWK